MNDTIYLVCARLERQSGGYDYDPAIDPTSPHEIKMLAGNDLVALQNENMDAMEALREIANVVIVPVSFETYNQLDAELHNTVANVDKALDEAVEKMAAAYRIMGIQPDLEAMKEQMMLQATSCGSAGKVLNEDMEIVDRADDYITYSSEYDDDDDYEEDDDYEDEDEDYEDDEEY